MGPFYAIVIVCSLATPQGAGGCNEASSKESYATVDACGQVLAGFVDNALPFLTKGMQGQQKKEAACVDKKDVEAVEAWMAKLRDAPQPEEKPDGPVDSEGKYPTGF